MVRSLFSGLEMPKIQVDMLGYTAALRGLFGSKQGSSVITDYLVRHEIGRTLLQPWMCWQPNTYTRNVLHRENLFEVVLLCWDFGAATPIHDHGGQRCWTTVVKGQLLVESFELTNPQMQRRTGAGIWLNAGASLRHLPAGHTEYCSRTATPHRVSNPATWDRRAITVQVYARPLRTYTTYDPRSGVASQCSA